MTSNVKSMKAAVAGSAGIGIVDTPVPTLGDTDVLIRVRAAAMNHADLDLYSGDFSRGHGKQGDVSGLECAGDVVAVGRSAERVKVGDRVMTSCRGAFAEFAVADWGRVMPIPDSLSYEQATCLPVAMQTMHDAIVTNGQIKSSDIVLIQGAASAVGLVGVQAAKRLGAKMVIGTSSSPQRRESLMKLGADLMLDSRKDGWWLELKSATQDHGADLIIDMLSGSAANGNLQAAALEGRIVNVGRLAGNVAPFDFDLHALKRIRYQGVTFRTRTPAEVRVITAAMLKDWGANLGSGGFVMPVDSVVRLDSLTAAFERMKANQHFGKIVVRVAD